MTPPSKTFKLIVLAGCILFCILSRVYGGPTGLMGALAGVFATGFNILALAAIVWLAGKSPDDAKTSPLTGSMAAIAFLIKLPLFVGVGIITNRIGGHAPACFLLGLALVYSALIGWVLAIR
ncbi:hypothetical protein BH11ARM1_BH11ARM1_12320 [soil metagenome]